MGLCQSAEDKELTLKSKAIDKEMMANHMSQAKVVKLLLLGAGECGKSTVLKQMRILHDHGFTAEESEQQKSVVFNNTLQAMISILKGMESLRMTFDKPIRENDAKFVMEAHKMLQEAKVFPEELANALQALYSDKGIQTVMAKGNEFQMPESAPHFLGSLDRIKLPDYTPTEQDILLSRIKTTGIVEVKFQMKSVDFRVFDVGGQRSERKKWIHCFEDVNAIIFIAAISEYDQVLFEDETTNRMIESMRLFESICNSRWFINTSMILFLNKKDLFAEKIKRTSIKSAFPDYKGAQTYDESCRYIEEKFDGLNANPEKTIYMHQTCATDTDQVQMILDSVIDMIIQANLQGCESVINDTHSDKQGNFELTANTIEQVYTPYIAVYHDCDDGVKPGQRKIKFEIPKYYVGSGLTFDLGSFNLETRVKHNEERQSHVDRRRRHQEELVERRRTTQNVFRGRDEEPDERNDTW
ncbi:hypothetical protein B9Z55_020188 [Caenorhabditis nigoni]|uniref:Guanine nucleotide-binding protein alpha-3 subunit n=1 Tax=Caenorhabditis nigoni TaxID=1611254 RepID=A0A2G5TLP4_9PELO|nr:hypothetical protein B9Z55_020188 [Caenorhabditis nigoni]